MKLPNKWRPTADHIQWLQKICQHAQNTANLVVRMRAKPGVGDYLALGVSGVNLGTAIYNDVKAARSVDPNGVFKSSEWTQVPPMMTKLLEPMFTVVRVEATNPNFRSKDPLEARTVRLDRFECGVVAVGSVIHRLYVKTSELAAFAAFTEEKLWSTFPKRQITVSGREIMADEADLTKAIDTDMISLLKERVLKFKDAGVARSYMLIGAPGTGKTTAVTKITRDLNLRSLRLPISFLQGDRYVSSNASVAATWDLGLLLTVLNPDALIIDDLDRLDSNRQSELLYLIETARLSSKLLFCTVNKTDNVLAPLLRPGRFDDLIHFERLDNRSYEAVMGPGLYERYGSKLGRWPIVYVADFVKRVEVLGEAVAVSEIPLLESAMKAMASSEGIEDPLEAGL